MFFETSWSLRAYGRPATIFAQYASPIPGRALSWSEEAELMSSRAPLFLAVSATFAGAFLGASLVWASAMPATRAQAKRGAISRRKIGVFMTLVYPLT